MANSADLLPFTPTLLGRAAKMAKQQMQDAKDLLIEMGVDEKHGEYHAILASVMQTLAANHLAEVTRSKS